MEEYLVYDKNNSYYNVNEVEKIMEKSKESADNFTIELHCSYCNNFIYFRYATAKRRAQLCHYKYGKCNKERPKKKS